MCSRGKGDEEDDRGPFPTLLCTPGAFNQQLGGTWKQLPSVAALGVCGSSIDSSGTYPLLEKMSLSVYLKKLNVKKGNLSAFTTLLTPPLCPPDGSFLVLQLPGLGNTVRRCQTAGTQGRPLPTGEAWEGKPKEEGGGWEETRQPGEDLLSFLLLFYLIFLIFDCPAA